MPSEIDCRFGISDPMLALTWQNQKQTVLCPAHTNSKLTTGVSKSLIAWTYMRRFCESDTVQGVAVVAIAIRFLSIDSSISSQSSA